MSSNRPSRGGQEYYRRMFAVAEQPAAEPFVTALAKGWKQYGRRAAVDVATELVCAIDYITPPVSRYRDFTGCVRLDAFDGVVSMRSQEFILQRATVAVPEIAAEKGTSVHEEFAKANRVTANFLARIEMWVPVLTGALRAAHGAHHRDPVRAALFQGPGLRQEDWPVVRDGLMYLHSIAHVPMRAAKELGKPVRPPMLEWLDQDLSVAPNAIMSALMEGELSSEC